MQVDDGQASAQNSQIEKLNDEIAEAMIHDPTEQYLTFLIGDEEYGVNILSVEEIRGWEGATPIPNSPRHVLGVVNLRGTVAPVVDLKLCFGLPAIEYSPLTVVIVLKVKSGTNHKTVGVAVDAVSDVYNFAAGDIQSAPEIANTGLRNFVKGLGSAEEKMVILLDINDQILQDAPVTAQVSGSEPQVALN